MNRTNPRLALTSCLAALCAAACSDSQAADDAKAAAAAPVAAAVSLGAQKAIQTPDQAALDPESLKVIEIALALPEEAALEPWRLELIELAMDAAGAFPVYPHIKNRSLAQESVVETCIALDQPRRALKYSAQIGNWRRGVGYADLALHLAERGVNEGVDELVALAEVEARLEGEENPQDWQKDLIRSKIAATLLKLGRAGDAEPFEAGLQDAEVGTVAAAKATLLSREELEARLTELDELVVTATLDQLRSALQAAVELYQRTLADAGLRARCDDWIARASLKVPAQVRLETRLELARRAAAQGDPAEAQVQVGRAREVLDGTKWLPEDQVPLTARVAEARVAAGDLERARAEVAEAVKLFEHGREQIQDFWRGAALRPVAEACVAVGDRAQALQLYRLAAEEGVHNPNARPRADDLVATCLSMARHGVQPDAPLGARLRSTREGLVDPW